MEVVTEANIGINGTWKDVTLLQNKMLVPLQEFGFLFIWSYVLVVLVHNGHFGDLCL